MKNYQLRNRTARQRAAAKRFQRDFLDKAGGDLTLLRDIADTLGYAFYIKAGDYRLVMLNALNCMNCGFADEWEAVGLRSDEVFPPELSQFWINADRTTMANGRPQTFHGRGHAPDYSNRNGEKHIFPVRDAAGRILGTTCFYRLTEKNEGGDSDDSRRLSVVTRYINDHYAEALSMPMLAAMLKITPSQLARIARATLGIPLQQYIIKMRLNAAAKMLADTDEPIASIAQATGFFDQSHLSHAFRGERGITPSEYRRRTRRLQHP